MAWLEIPETGLSINGLMMCSHLQQLSAIRDWCMMHSQSLVTSLLAVPKKRDDTARSRWASGSQVIQVHESRIFILSPHVATAHAAVEKTVLWVNKLGQIHKGQFFSSLADNIRHQMTCTTSSMSTSGKKHHMTITKKLMHDTKVINPVNWPKKRVRHTIWWCWGAMAVKSAQTWEKGESSHVLWKQGYQGLLYTCCVRACTNSCQIYIAVCPSESEKAFRTINDIFPAKRPPLGQFNPDAYVRSWLSKGRRSAEKRACRGLFCDTAVP